LSDQIVPYIRDLPIYGQHPNGCGLATLLMLLKPNLNKDITEFLDFTWVSIKEILGDLPFKAKEYFWAIALQYLLLKSVGYSENSKKEEIYSFFNERMEYVFEDQRILNKFNQEQFREFLMKKNLLEEAFTYLHYLEGDDYVTPHLLIKNLKTMKTDIELKVLAEIFNYQFEYQESEDYTGAIYFNKKELKNKINEITKKKWLKLEELANNPKNILIYGKSHHWLAIRGVYRVFQLEGEKLKEQNITNNSSDSKNSSDPTKSSPILTENEKWNIKYMIIEVSDPASKKIIQLHFRHITDKDRIYIFNKRAGLGYDIFKRFKENYKPDIIEESRRWNEFVKKRNTDQKLPEDIINKIKERENKANSTSSKSDKDFLEFLEED
jgi:hypothetical protein